MNYLNRLSKERVVNPDQYLIYETDHFRLVITHFCNQRYEIFHIDILYNVFFLFSVDERFLISLDFLWKVTVITLVSCLPLYILKFLRRKYAPPSYSKLT